MMERLQLVMLRRQLIDRMTNILPNCELFEANAFYPKRYFDDLMVLEAGGQIDRGSTFHVDKSAEQNLNLNTDLNSIAGGRESGLRFSTLQPNDT